MMSGWISVKDRLPENGESVIVYCYWDKSTSKSLPLNYNFFATFYNGTFHSADGALFYPDDVNYWMPLPKPPKPE